MGSASFVLVWMPVRFFVEREWLVAGEEMLCSDGWMQGGASLKGYWTNAVAVPKKRHAAVT